MFDCVICRPPKILKFLKRTQCGANHRNCYNAKRFLLNLTLIDWHSSLTAFSINTKEPFLVPWCQWWVFSSSESPWAYKIDLAGNYILKVNNRNTRTTCEICSDSTLKTPERRLYHPSLKQVITLSRES